MKRDLVYPCFESQTDSTSNPVQRLWITRLLTPTCLISVLRLDVAEICDFLGYYAVIPYLRFGTKYPLKMFFNHALQSFKAYCAIWVKRSNFRHQASPRVSPRGSTQRRRVKLWARNARKFFLNAEFHVTFRALLHAVKLRHGTDGFTSPPKNPTASAGCEPANFGAKGQHATSRPPKPLSLGDSFFRNFGKKLLLLAGL
jgi:hypothetical protein